MEDVRAQHNQQRSGGECNVGKDLNKVMNMTSLEYIRHAHEFENDPCLGVVRTQYDHMRKWDAGLT